MRIGNGEIGNIVTDPNSVGSNSSINDVIGNKDDANLSGPGNDSLYGIAGFMSYYHVHSPALIYPRDADPANVTAGVGAWTEGSKVEVIAENEKTEAFDIHHAILGKISATDNYVLKIYSGNVGEEVFWGETAFSRDTYQQRGSSVPVQGPPIPKNTRVSISLLSGSGSDNVDVKLYTHEYPAGK